MAKTVKPRASNTKLAAVEKLFGPVLPGPSSSESTISVFQEYSSPRKYKLYGLLGFLDGAIWHLHTQIPIIPSKAKGRITGIVEEGKQHDPYRQQMAVQWLADYKAAESTKQAAVAQKAAADEVKKKEIQQKKEEARLAAEAKRAAAVEARRQRELAAALERQRKQELAKRAAARAGEYEAQLVIGGIINATINVRINVDLKGKVTLAAPKRKGFQLPPLS